MSQITTHILDTAAGKPAEGIRIVLEQPNGDKWEKITEGITNNDGRVANFLPADKVLPPAVYRITFFTADYHKKQGIKGFYPSVSILFETTDTSHYHVPLLLNPFGYSTYRGS